jgi:hypothetical protein
MRIIFIFFNCLVTKVWSNGVASRATVFALAGSNPASDNILNVLVAQWIERSTSNREAAGSSPA